MKSALVLLLLCALTGCAMNYASESYENYLPEVRLTEANDDERGVYIEWDEPLRSPRTVMIEMIGYRTQGREYEIWKHHGKPKDEIPIYLTPYEPRYHVFKFEPGSVSVFWRVDNNPVITVVRILTTAKARATGHYRERTTSGNLTTVHPTVQNFRIGESKELVLERNIGDNR